MAATLTRVGSRTPSADELSNCFRTVNTVAGKLHERYISGSLSRTDYYNDISELYSGLICEYLAVVHGLPENSGTFYFDSYLRSMRPDWF